MHLLESVLAFASAHPLGFVCALAISGHYAVKGIAATLRGIAELLHGVPENVPLVHVPDRIRLTADVRDSSEPWRSGADEEDDADEDEADESEDRPPRFGRIRAWFGAVGRRFFRSRVDFQVAPETKVRPRFDPDTLLENGVIDAGATFDALPQQGRLYCVREVEMKAGSLRIRLVGITGSKRADGSEHSFDMRGFFVAGKETSS